jgi:hypothetical protein
MATWQSHHDLRSDPWVVEKVQKAVSKWEGTLRAEELAWMREQLFETLANDPRATRIMRVAHPKIADESGAVTHGTDAKAVKARGRTSG